MGGAVAALEATDLAGAWASAALEPVERPDGSQHFTRRTLEFDGEAFVMGATVWADEACEKPLFSLHSAGLFVLGPEWEAVPGARTLDLGFRTREMTLLHPPLLDRVRAGGHPEAALGRPVSLARWGALRVPSVREAPAEYDLVVLADDGMLHLGERGPGTYRREGRPQRAHAHGLSRAGTPTG